MTKTTPPSPLIAAVREMIDDNLLCLMYQELTSSRTRDAIVAKLTPLLEAAEAVRSDFTILERDGERRYYQGTREMTVVYHMDQYDAAKAALQDARERDPAAGARPAVIHR